MPESEKSELLPIGDVFPGVHLAGLPDDCVVETLFVFSKLRLDDGTSVWQWRSPGITNHEELLGALIMHTEMLKASLLEDWE